MQSKEDVNDQLIRYVLETLAEVADAALRVLFEDLVLRVHLVELVGESSSNDIGQDLLKGLLIRVLLNSLSTCVSLVIGLLAHLADLLVHSLHGDWLDLSHWHAINRLLVLLGLRLVLRVLETLLHLFVCKVASLARFVKPSLETLILARSHVTLRDVESGVLHGDLVVDALNLVLLHLLGDCGAQVLGPILGLVLELLNLDIGGLVIKSKTLKQSSTYSLSVSMV